MKKVNIDLFKGIYGGHYVKCPTCDELLTDTKDIKIERRLGKFCKFCGEELDYSEALNYKQPTLEEIKKHYRSDE